MSSQRQASHRPQLRNTATHASTAPGRGSRTGVAHRPRNRQLVRELIDQLSPEQAPLAVRALADAQRDLRGSISDEGLPEMSYRLAHFRLTGGQAVAQVRSSGAVS